MNRAHQKKIPNLQKDQLVYSLPVQWILEKTPESGKFIRTFLSKEVQEYPISNKKKNPLKHQKILLSHQKLRKLAGMKFSIEVSNFMLLYTPF